MLVTQHTPGEFLEGFACTHGVHTVIARGRSRLVRAASIPRRRLKAATKLSTILDTTPCTSTALHQCVHAHGVPGKKNQDSAALYMNEPLHQQYNLCTPASDAATSVCRITDLGLSAGGWGGGSHSWLLEPEVHGYWLLDLQGGGASSL